MSNAVLHATATEVELKLTLDPERAAALRARVAALSTDRPAQVQTLSTVYYDTPDRRLREAGLALRLRADGAGWTQTVKRKLRTDTGLQRAVEAHSAAPDARLRLKAIPDKRLRKSVRAIATRRALAPVCETRMERMAASLRGPDGAEVEIVVDDGEIRAGDRRAAFCEAEIELKTGEVGALYDLAAALLPDGGLDFSRLSKAARGYRLAETGSIAPPLAPRRAKPVLLTPKMSTEAAVQAVLRETFDQIAANLEVVRKSDDPEGPHQLRIGLRRLRTALRMFRPVLAGQTRDWLASEAAWLGRAVGAQRDLDVIGHDLLIPALAESPDPDALRTLITAFADRATTHRETLRMILATTRVQRFVLALGRYTEGCGWREDGASTRRLRRPVRPLMRAALGRAWSRCAHRAEGIATLDIDARHDLRKVLKGLRYSLEFAAPLLPARDVTRVTKRLKRLQAVFGDLNDLAMADAMLAGPDSPAAGTPRLEAAVAALRTRGEARAAESWTEAQALWRALARRRKVLA